MGHFRRLLARARARAGGRAFWFAFLVMLAALVVFLLWAAETVVGHAFAVWVTHPVEEGIRTVLATVWQWEIAHPVAGLFVPLNAYIAFLLTSALVWDLWEYLRGQPRIVFHRVSDDESDHGKGEIYVYTHIWFHNEPSGTDAPMVSARIVLWDVTRTKEIYSETGKWMEKTAAAHDRYTENHVDFAANAHPHALDLFVRRKGEADCYLHFVDSWRHPHGCDPSRRVPPGLYKANVTLSREGFTKDFSFEVQNHGKDSAVSVLLLSQ